MNRPPQLHLRRALAGALAIGAIGVLAPLPAQAHFILEAPASWMSQDLVGSPQKLGPCGDEGGGTPSGTVTAFQAGQTITVTIDEKIFHPGHYRIALAESDPAKLPPEPIVTPANTPCGSAPIMNPPVYPVLADGVFLHTTAFNGPQSVKITLPSNVTCTKCTLQVLEFMSNHPLNPQGGCFYHHCANISITAAGSSSSATGSSSSATGSTGPGSTSSSGPGPASTGASGGSEGSGGSSSGGTHSPAGCGCSVPTSPTPAAIGLAGLFGLATWMRRRRRR